MCFSNKYKYRTLNKGCYYIITKNKTSRKRKSSILWKIVLSNFSIFDTKKLCFILHYIIQYNTFDVALLEQKIWCGRVTLNEVLNNYGLNLNHYLYPKASFIKNFLYVKYIKWLPSLCTKNLIWEKCLTVYSLVCTKC